MLTGYNEAFIISTEKREEILANCQSDDERERTAELIRPILSGRDIKRYGYNWANLWFINTHNGIRSWTVFILRITLLSNVILIIIGTEYPKRADKGDTTI